MAYYFLHDSVVADDVVQEAFTRGLAHLHTYRGDSKPEVWLYSIALNVCRQALRKSRVEEGAPPGELDRKPAPERSPLTSVIRRETRVRLVLALGHLTDLQREAFVLHYIEELPHEAIAPMLGVSVVGSRGLAHRAREALRRHLPPNYRVPGTS